jgi:hypothetical protein
MPAIINFLPKKGGAMKILYLLILLCLLAFQHYYPQVTINIPADYPTIQEGNSVSCHGDIVLVAEGK